MERHVDLSLLSVRTEVSDWLMYHPCVISNFFALVLLNLFTIRNRLYFFKNIIVLYSINLS